MLDMVSQKQDKMHTQMNRIAIVKQIHPPLTKHWEYSTRNRRGRATQSSQSKSAFKLNHLLTAFQRGNSANVNRN